VNKVSTNLSQLVRTEFDLNGDGKIDREEVNVAAARSRLLQSRLRDYRIVALVVFALLILLCGALLGIAIAAMRLTAQTQVNNGSLQDRNGNTLQTGISYTRVSFADVSATDSATLNRVVKAQYTLSSGTLYGRKVFGWAKRSSVYIFPLSTDFAGERLEVTPATSTSALQVLYFADSSAAGVAVLSSTSEFGGVFAYD